MKINGIEIPEVMNFYDTDPRYDQFVDVMIEQLRNELFTFESYNDLSSLCFEFERCTLLINMGKYIAGAYIPCIMIDWKIKELELLDDGCHCLGKFNFKLSTLNGIID